MNVLEHFYLKVLPEYAQVIRETFLSIHGQVNDFKLHIAESHLGKMELHGYKIEITIEDGLYFKLQTTVGEIQVVHPDELLNISLGERVLPAPPALRLINRPLGRLIMVDKKWRIIGKSGMPEIVGDYIRWRCHIPLFAGEIGHVIVE